MTHSFIRGMRIVESSAFIASAMAGLSLAQLGADVIRIDAIGGGIDYRRMPMMPGGRSIYWTSLNKGKRSLALDFRSPEGREVMAALITAPGPDAGVFLSNIPVPWLDPATLARTRRDVITCLIEGNPDGTTAVDYTVNCATGLPEMTGTGSADRPINHVLPAWDLVCAHNAASAVLAALLRRRATGEGAALRIALSDVAFAGVSHLGMLAEAELTGTVRRSSGNDLYGAFGHDFATQDHRRVMVAAISLRQWRALVKACDLTALIAQIEAAAQLNFDHEDDRFAGRDIIAALVKRWCVTRTLEQIVEVFTREGVCWGKYQNLRQALDTDPRVSLDNPMFEQTTTAGVGSHRQAGSPIRDSAHPRRPTPSAPYLGADTDQVLAEVLGLSSLQIGRLHDKGVVAGPEKADPFFGV